MLCVHPLSPRPLTCSWLSAGDGAGGRQRCCCCVQAGGESPRQAEQRASRSKTRPPVVGRGFGGEGRPCSRGGREKARSVHAQCRSPRSLCGSHQPPRSSAPCGDHDAPRQPTRPGWCSGAASCETPPIAAQLPAAGPEHLHNLGRAFPSLGQTTAKTHARMKKDGNTAPSCSGRPC